MPRVLEPETVYLIGDGQLPWSAALLCPCGCKAIIHLSLVSGGGGDQARWNAKRNFNGSVSLHPSVWRKRGCRSHFFLRRGHIVWCGSYNQVATRR